MVAYVKANTRVQCNIYKLSGAVTPLVPLTALSEELWPHKCDIAQPKCQFHSCSGQDLVGNNSLVAATSAAIIFNYLQLFNKNANVTAQQI